ncbi:hypothetical protein [Burkholderia ubonensis]|uniref:hypothetical protein n=1 Tax=Burkholderia ubonensis TaxID=101571 RepID=UPI00075F4B8C|nr:hypothetical protein [Burkholderia ubonensis]KVP17191.1 hypothetical protein WJ84_02615 [Burkholderia ubonensis]
MGSFNIKCFVTGQVIAEREKCRIAVILQQSTYRPAKVVFRDQELELYGVRKHASGTDAHWDPMTGFMSGTYADYGKVTLDATPENLTMLAELFNEMNRRCAKTLASERDPEFDFKALTAKYAPKLHALFAAQTHFLDCISPDELDIEEAQALWDEVEDAVCEERVFFANGSQVLRPLKMAVMHEVSFQRLVALAESFKRFDDSAFAREEYFERAFSKLREELADVDDDMKRFVRKDNFRESLRLRLDGGEVHHVTWAFRRRFEAAVEAVIESGQPVSYFLEACKEPLDVLYALAGLSALRVQYAPITYAGQDYDNVTGKRYADFVTGASAEICAARKARYGDDE